jgi:hypothetical protein
MTIERILFAAAFCTAFLYMFLGLLAYGNRNKKESSEQGWALSPLWALFPSAYNEKGKTQCARGKLVFWFSMIASTTWLIVK